VNNLGEYYNYFLWNTSPKDTETDDNIDIQMTNILPIKPLKKLVSCTREVLKTEIKENITSDELVLLINKEITYINKKMTMVKTVADVSVEDIMSKTKLIEILKQLQQNDFYICNVTEIINY
tara:strand:+ start:276 stop:641 length:366 start_codon:yes stop_codon:yes gene_type:complete